MAQTFSLPSDGLGYFIGYTLYDSSRVAFVSPWISDIDITLPVIEGVDERKVSLTEAIKKVGGDTSVLVMIQSGQESHNSYVTSRLPEWVEVRSVDDLHAKAVVGEEFAYTGSANITQRGLHTNKELCRIEENEYSSVDEYIQSEI